MPELPEVETIRRQLVPLVEGRHLARLDVLDPRWSRPLDPRQLSGVVVGRRITSLVRRGKYLVWEMTAEVYLIMHLRMTGTLLADPVVEPPHVRARIGLDDGSRVLFVDPRRFGTGELARGAAGLERFMGVRLGVEPLSPEFTASRLRALARGRRSPIKAFLLDQRHVAGVGNIYADEALHRAGVHPLRPAGRLTTSEHVRLHAAIVEALSAGIDARGASIDDFRHVDGVRGSFQDQFRVHRRAGRPCPGCGAEVVKFVAAGRGTYACERCQPRPRRRG